MYELPNIIAHITRVGKMNFIRLISEDSFPCEIKEALEKERIILGGYPNVSLIEALVP